MERRQEKRTEMGMVIQLLKIVMIEIPRETQRQRSAVMG